MTSWQDLRNSSSLPVAAQPTLSQGWVKGSCFCLLVGFMVPEAVGAFASFPIAWAGFLGFGWFGFYA